jgi:hypothetical protein
LISSELVRAIELIPAPSVAPCNDRNLDRNNKACRVDASVSAAEIAVDSPFWASCAERNRSSVAQETVGLWRERRKNV